MRIDIWDSELVWSLSGLRYVKRVNKDDYGMSWIIVEDKKYSLLEGPIEVTS